MQKNGQFQTNATHSSENVQDFANMISAQLEAYNQGIAHLASLMHDIKVASENNIRHEWHQLKLNNDVRLNFDAISVYIDNANNANPITLNTGASRGSFIIPAGTQQWIHPLGSRNFELSGDAPTTQVFANFVDTLIPLAY